MENSSACGKYTISGLFPRYGADINVAGVSRISTNDRMFLYINGRFSRISALERAVTKVFRSSFQHATISRRYPFTVLFFTVPRHECDVNLSPDKTEMIISQLENMVEFASSSLEETLANQKAAAHALAASAAEGKYPSTPEPESQSDLAAGGDKPVVDRETSFTSELRGVTIAHQQQRAPEVEEKQQTEGPSALQCMLEGKEVEAREKDDDDLATIDSHSVASSGHPQAQNGPSESPREPVQVVIEDLNREQHRRPSISSDIHMEVERSSIEQGEVHAHFVDNVFASSVESTSAHVEAINSDPQPIDIQNAGNCPAQERSPTLEPTAALLPDSLGSPFLFAQQPVPSVVPPADLPDQVEEDDNPAAMNIEVLDSPHVSESVVDDERRADSSARQSALPFAALLDADMPSGESTSSAASSHNHSPRNSRPAAAHRIPQQRPTKRAAPARNREEGVQAENIRHGNNNRNERQRPTGSTKKVRISNSNASVDDDGESSDDFVIAQSTQVIETDVESISSAFSSFVDRKKSSEKKGENFASNDSDGNVKLILSAPLESGHMLLFQDSIDRNTQELPVYAFSHMRALEYSLYSKMLKTFVVESCRMDAAIILDSNFPSLLPQERMDFCNLFLDIVADRGHEINDHPQSWILTLLHRCGFALACKKIKRRHDIRNESDPTHVNIVELCEVPTNQSICLDDFLELVRYILTNRDRPEIPDPAFRPSAIRALFIREARRLARGRFQDDRLPTEKEISNILKKLGFTPSMPSSAESRLSLSLPGASELEALNDTLCPHGQPVFMKLVGPKLDCSLSVVSYSSVLSSSASSSSA